MTSTVTMNDSYLRGLYHDSTADEREVVSKLFYYKRGCLDNQKPCFFMLAAVSDRSRGLYIYWHIGYLGQPFIEGMSGPS